jgi:hypothetical protein
MRLSSILVLLITCPAVYCQNLPQPLTQVDACRNFRASVVQVDTDTMHGTGFIVSPDGWIMTALHVVANPQTLVKYDNISVLIHGHKTPAEIMSPLDSRTRARDFAVLKIEGTDLPPLNLGSEINLEDGSQIAVIGFPLSAVSNIPITAIPGFCLTGTIASHSTLPLGKNLEFLHTIYFQGVSIKGISGAPIISLQTGKVVGIVSTRMTGINSVLGEIRDSVDNSVAEARARGVGTRMTVHGTDPALDVANIIKVLDEQLANGLGTGTGASDVAIALNEAKKNYERKPPTK